MAQKKKLTPMQKIQQQHQKDWVKTAKQKNIPKELISKVKSRFEAGK